MDSGGGKITLDQESFRALASDVRVEVLKRLDARRETVTDLSNLLSLSKPTLLEHLEKLQAAGLVKRVDEGRKWIYYELSDKGRKILHPERVAITLALSTAVAFAIVGVVFVLSASGGMLAGPESADSRLAPNFMAVSESSFVPLLLFGLSAATAFVALGLRLYGRQRRARFFAALGAS